MRKIKKAISVKEAENIILGTVRTLGTQVVRLTNAEGYVLAENLCATFDIPSFTNSAMDGYAVCAEDIRTAKKGRPALLRIVETVAAGHSPVQKLGPGQAIAVMTGGLVPRGADTIVPVEDTEMERKNSGQKGSSARLVGIFRPLSKGANIRHKGEITKRGRLILKKFSHLDPICIGVLATFNHHTVKVFRKPRIAILSTGDELVPLGHAIPPGKIVDSNHHMVVSELRKHGFTVINFGIVRDNRKETLQKFQRAAQLADVVITIGGVSMGLFDYVKDCIRALGSLKIQKVKMKPGGPLTFGIIRKKPIFSLPGNPVSTLLTLRLFVLPALHKMSGRKDFALQWKTIPLSFTCHPTEHKVRFQGIQIANTPHGDVATLLPSVGSHDLLAWIGADGVAKIPSGKKILPRGKKVFVTSWI